MSFVTIPVIELFSRPCQHRYRCFPDDGCILGVGSEAHCRLDSMNIVEGKNR